MRIPLKWGRQTISLELDLPASPVHVLEPGRSCAGCAEEELVRLALAQPIGCPPLADIARPGQRIAVVASDITRPCPTALLLPPLLDELGRAGIHDSDITIFFGLGSHRKHTPDEQRSLVGNDIVGRLRCLDSDPDDVIDVGCTRRGTPVAVYRPLLDADVRVCLGAIEYHYFAGFSGGYKAIIPGLASARTIQRNHSMMTQAGAEPGRLDGNPVREDLDEAGELVGVHFLLNVILDTDHRIVGAVAGHPRLAHRAGCARLDGFGRAFLPQPADVVIASAGGYPKDINLYQAQKALDNARLIVRPGGIILLVAACPEGMGHPVFASWMEDPGGPEAIIARICREFVLGGHKAAAVALAMKQASIFLLSEMPAAYARSVGFTPFSDLNEAVGAALADAGPSPVVAVMPEGGSVLPSLARESAPEPSYSSEEPCT